MNWIHLALAGCALLSVLALAISLVALRASHRQVDQLKSSHRRLESELAVVNSAAIGMGNRLLSMEKRVQQGGGLSDSAAGPSDQPYTEANQLFRMGMDVEEVSRRCGLSRAEASLLQAMQEHR
ncbi:DUF2802 domain-containing protein [Marinimicrobium sp. C2-29]|uniref:DUF2802 domain-containing protein n=1 Tax=Marinimicrobium sp. C2-29 TaxID=3139825 RepID=UPI00313A3BCA